MDEPGCITWLIKPKIVTWTTDREYLVMDGGSVAVLATCTTREAAERAVDELHALMRKVQ